MSDPRIELLLSIADDEFITGHRLAEWTGWVPYVEEDLAMSSIAQDEMGHARLLYEIVSAWDGRDVDALALGRRADEYRHAVLCERPNRDFAFTLARHWLYDHADDVRIASLASTTSKELRDAIEIMRLEEAYHLAHADAWFTRIVDGPVDARRRFADALGDAVGEAMALFEPLPNEEALVADGIMPTASEDLLAVWLDRIGTRLDEAGLEHVLGASTDGAGEMVPTASGAIERTDDDRVLSVPGLVRRDGRWMHEGEFAGAGGRHGHHSDDFDPVWTEMTAMYREYPGATW